MESLDYAQYLISSTDPGLNSATKMGVEYGRDVADRNIFVAAGRW